MFKTMLYEELLDSFLEETVEWKNSITNTINGHHTYEITDTDTEIFSKYSFNNRFNWDDYIDVSKFFSKVTDKVKLLQDLSHISYKQGLLNLTSILLDKNTYGVLFKPTIDYRINEFRSKEANYISLSNPLSLIDSCRGLNLMDQMCFRSIDIFVFEYDADSFTTDIPTEEKKHLYTFLSDSCKLFYKTIQKEREEEENEVKEDTKSELFFTCSNKGYNQILFDKNPQNSLAKTYLTYSDIMVKDSVCPTYAVWKILKASQGIKGFYLDNQPIISPNVSVAGNICTGKLSNTTDKGIDTLLVSNNKSPFTTKLFNKRTFRTWVELNKILAIRWLETLCDVTLLQEANNDTK